MKKILLFSLMALITTIGYSQESNYKAKIDGWYVDIDEAYEISKKTGKPILANFTGSDWCGWCKRLVSSVFSKPDFQKWAEENVILLELDYPRRTKVPEDIRRQNQQLKNAFKITGFPTIWVFNIDKDKEGKFNIESLGKTGYRKTVAEFTNDVDRMLARKKKSGK